MRSCGGGDRSRQRGRVTTDLGLAALRASAPALAFHEGPVLADEQLEMRALLVGELQENFLALGVLEFFAVAFEETVRAALALDADHQRLPVVDPVGEPLRPGRE